MNLNAISWAWSVLKKNLQIFCYDFVRISNTWSRFKLNTCISDRFMVYFALVFVRVLMSVNLKKRRFSMHFPGDFILSSEALKGRLNSNYFIVYFGFYPTSVRIFSPNFYLKLKALPKMINFDLISLFVYFNFFPYI